MFAYLFHAIKALTSVFVIGNLCAMEVDPPNVPLASHLEVALYRLEKAHNIEEQKRTHNTQLNAVAVLLNLEDALATTQIDQLKFSRLVLGIISGRGFAEGVIHMPKFSAQDRAIIERIVQRAMSYVILPNFQIANIWSAARGPAIGQHIEVLNRLAKQGVRGAGGDAEGRKAAVITLGAALPYDISITELPRIIYTPPANIVVPVIPLRPDIVRLINAIPLTPPGALDPDARLYSNISLEQRNAIRACINAINAPGGVASSAEKEVHIDALTQRLTQIFGPQAQDGEAIRQIEGIELYPVIKNRQERMQRFGPNTMNPSKLAIAALPNIARDLHYKILIARIRQVVPAFLPRDDESFADFIERVDVIKGETRDFHQNLINELNTLRINAITPLKELISTDPVIEPMPIVDSVYDVRNIDLQVGAPDPRNARFETRLKNFLLNHWERYYKTGDEVFDFGPIRDALQQKFDTLVGTHIEKKIRKVELIESILYRLLKTPGVHNFNVFRDLVADAIVPPLPGFVPEDNPPVSYVYTNMEKIRELPSTDWNQALEVHVFTPTPALRRGAGEDERIYWSPIGTYIIGIYNTKIKPYIYPDGLSANLLANDGEVRQLVTLSMMFSYANDAGYALTFADGELEGVNAGEYNRRIFNCDMSRAALNAGGPGFKQNVTKGYKRIHAYFIKSVKELFGIGDTLPYVAGVGAPLVHPWYTGGAAGENIFTPERIILCKKLLLMMTRLNRPGNNYMDDLAMIAALVGRFTHCVDGKKTGIEETAYNTFLAYTGGEAALDGINTLDEFLKRLVLMSFKTDAIGLLAEHTHHHENTSIVALIKNRNQEFWNVETHVAADHLGEYQNSDYWIHINNNADFITRYFYQHIYVGPHELINAIHRHLKAAHFQVREKFNEIVFRTLQNIPPFSAWEDMASYTDFVQQRYCANISPSGATEAQAVAAEAAERAAIEAENHLEAARQELQRIGEDPARFEELANAHESVEDNNLILEAARQEAVARREEVNAANAAAQEAADDDYTRATPPPDYLITRKGLEAVLLYGGYLGWHGIAAQHPLVSEWKANLAWLKRKYLADYNNTYLPE